MVLRIPESPLPGQLKPEVTDEALLESVAKRVVAMGMATPAVFFLESTKPLSYIGSQVLVFLEPFVKSFLNLASYDRFVALMEDRKNIETLMVRIEALDEQAQDAEQARKRAEREEKKHPKNGGVGAAKTSQPSNPWAPGLLARGFGWKKHEGPKP